MGMIKLPRYLRSRKLANGQTAFYWQPPDWARPPARRNGRLCPVGAEALGSNAAEAIAAADARNAAFDDWRNGSEPTHVRGSVAWLFGWYRKTKRFQSTSHKTKKDYDRMMALVAGWPMKQGLFGARSAAKVDGEAADKLYEKISARGDRTSQYAMQVCRLVWTQAVRHKRTTGVVDNPFSKMGIGSTAKGETRATSRAEYELYRQTAHELGFHSMAAAAALCFELLQRVWDVFGYADPEGRKVRGIMWEQYKSGKTISLKQSKTGKLIPIPLTLEAPDGETDYLYPELECELSHLGGGSGIIVREERNGRPYAERRVSTVHRLICDAAGLPKEMKFTGFRHGGITEVGDSGEPDVRPISGHKTLNTTAIYNKMNETKSRRIAAARRAHIKQLGADED